MDSVDLEVLKTSVRWLEHGRRVLLATVVKTWGSSPRPEGAMLALRDDGVVVGSVSGGCIEDDLIDRVRREGLRQTQPETVKYGISAEGAHRFGLPCGGTLQLVLGAGQLSRYLCQIAVGLDYQVTVCDPREEYSEEWDLPGVTMVRTMPDDTVLAMQLDERSAVIALTHDPKLDDLALMEALKTSAFYVGAHDSAPMIVRIPV